MDLQMLEKIILFPDHAGVVRVLMRWWADGTELFIWSALNLLFMQGC